MHNSLQQPHWSLDPRYSPASLSAGHECTTRGRASVQNGLHHWKQFSSACTLIHIGASPRRLRSAERTVYTYSYAGTCSGRSCVIIRGPCKVSRTHLRGYNVLNAGVPRRATRLARSCDPARLCWTFHIVGNHAALPMCSGPCELIYRGPLCRPYAVALQHRQMS